MKKIAVFFTLEAFDAYPLDKDLYRRAYKDLGELIEQRGGALFIVRGQKTYKDNNVFTHGWEYIDGTFQPHEKELTVDLIYDKGMFLADEDAVLVNDMQLDTICTDKSVTYEWFPELCPKTILVRNESELSHALRSMNTEMLVAKPLDGECGAGVYIAHTENLAKDITEYPYLIQEFIDSSGGIPGIVEGAHDLRIQSINGEVLLCSIRTPKPGTLIANTTQGGAKFELDITKIPQEALDMFHSIDEKLKQFGRRIYAIDLARDNDGTYKLIELNAKPGLIPIADGEGFKRFQEKLADVMMEE